MEKPTILSGSVGLVVETFVPGEYIVDFMQCIMMVFHAVHPDGRGTRIGNLDDDGRFHVWVGIEYEQEERFNKVLGVFCSSNNLDLAQR